MVRRDSSCESVVKRSVCSCECDEEHDAETASVASSTSSEGNGDNDLVIGDNTFSQYTPTFGKISVTNCNDIHFGNKTLYHGPVTIKQFLYTDGKLKKSEDVLSENDTGFNVPFPNDNKSTPNSCSNIGINYVISERNKCSPSDANTKTENPENKKGTGWICDFRKQHVILIVFLFIILVISLIISTIILLSRNQSVENDIVRYPSNNLNEEEFILGKSKDNGSYTLPGKLKMIARAEWLAQPPIQPPDSLKLPVPYVIIMHTATETCSDEPTCIFHVRHIQMYHIESRNWWDIGYNFLVGGDGFAYEGRGWKSEGAHTFGYNSRSIGIALIGTFTNVLPFQRQITATKQLIQKGVELGYIAKDYKLLGARQLQSTESPGKMFFEDLKLWEHWAETP